MKGPENKSIGGYADDTCGVVSVVLWYVCCKRIRLGWGRVRWDGVG